MIANTFLLAKQAVTGASILGCCCKDVVEEGGRPGSGDGGRRPTSLANPFITVGSTVDSQKPELDTAEIASYDTLVSEISEKPTPLVTFRERHTALGMSSTRIDRALQIAFQRMYYAEEMEFLVVLLAATEDECYEC